MVSGRSRSAVWADLVRSMFAALARPPHIDVVEDARILPSLSFTRFTVFALLVQRAMSETTVRHKSQGKTDASAAREKLLKVPVRLQCLAHLLLPRHWRSVPRSRTPVVRNVGDNLDIEASGEVGKAVVTWIFGEAVGGNGEAVVDETFGEAVTEELKWAVGEAVGENRCDKVVGELGEAVVEWAAGQAVGAACTSPDRGPTWAFRETLGGAIRETGGGEAVLVAVGSLVGQVGGAVGQAVGEAVGGHVCAPVGGVRGGAFGKAVGGMIRGETVGSAVGRAVGDMVVLVAGGAARVGAHGAPCDGGAEARAPSASTSSARARLRRLHRRACIK